MQVPVHVQQQLPVPVALGHVSDYAGLLGADARVIEGRLRRYETQTGHQVFVLTVWTAAPAPSIDAFAHAVFQAWRLGRKDINDGVLLVVAKNDRTMRLEVGTGLERVLTNDLAGGIVGQLLAPSFKRGDFAGGVDQATLAIMALLSPELAPKPAPVAHRIHVSSRTSGPLPGPLNEIVLFAAFGLLFLCITVLFGALGLVLTVLIGFVLPVVTYDGHWSAYALGITVVSTWVVLRCYFIGTALKKSLARSTRRAPLTFVYTFLFHMPKGTVVRTGGGMRVTRRNSSSKSSSSSSSRDSDASPGSGGGGSSSGGGASGSW